MQKRLRLLKDWGPYKAGDIHIAKSPTTVYWLVKMYKIAVVEEEAPPKVVKAVESPPLHKMIKKSPKAK
jgi:hypothetical protein